MNSSDQRGRGGGEVASSDRPRAERSGVGTPAEAAAIFGPSLPAAERYAGLLADAGVERGLIGPAEAGRVWDRHLLNCAAIAGLVRARGSLADIGSGAGLPGIVLALLKPGVQVTLVESMARRVSFLEECVDELGLTNVVIVRGRAEDLAGHLAVDVVTARAVAPLEKLAGLCLGLLKPGGLALAMKGASAGAELARARPVLAGLGVRDARVVEVGSGDGAAAATVVMFSAGGRPGRNRRPGPGRRPATNPGNLGRGLQPDAGRSGSRRGRPNARRGGS
jgi:16S rRNA (guanine527-N7)-methyltransferase